MRITFTQLISEILIDARIFLFIGNRKRQNIAHGQFGERNLGHLRQLLKTLFEPASTQSRPTRNHIMSHFTGTKRYRMREKAAPMSKTDGDRQNCFGQPP
jgi:hypothetical protein